MKAMNFFKKKIDPEGRTELHNAVIDGSVKKVCDLLSGGADVGAQDKAGWTPLHFAAQRNAIEIAAQLIKHNAPVDSQDSYGNTPLFRAVFESHGKGEMIARLRQGGADSMKKNKHGVSPVSLARTIGNYDVAQFFAGLP